MKILFVCTGNICRSFMAERILKKKLTENNCSNIEVSSAGVYSIEGVPGDPRAVKILTENGFNGYGHKSKLLTDEMVADADKIIVMENTHKKMIIDKYPDAEGKIFLLKSFSEDDHELYKDIKDPYGLSDYFYRLCFAEIYMTIEGLVKKCIKNIGVT
ncbi:MAG: low molecular weight protein arginine phosphatase [Syntrophales bacterium]|nr:low molecular weight protein arginine phosphatase [Syntrophales bacterium]